MTLGFVVGKFYPPHKGHKLLIDAAAARCDRLVVLLPHHPSQRIPGELRRDWLREVHPQPHVEVHLVPDEHGQDPVAWARFTVAHLGRPPDVVFSSEDYGPVFAGLMGCRHEMVDRARSVVPASGTLVRSDPLNHLHLLEPCVRAWFVRRVVLVGAESTGKTTLAAALAERFSTRWVPEYGREHWAAKLADRDPANDSPPSWSAEEFEQIAAEQQRRENLAARTANRVLFGDTNAWATGTWFERYMGHRSAAVDAIGARDVAHLYVLTDVRTPFVQDGFRDGERIREWMHARFESLLPSTGVPVVRVSGTHAERMATASAAVEELLARPFDL